ncbi:HD domain-containing phosphohydrolase [Paractinoplanes durhamensis]|uniref:HD domain-containing phosphohydrolase n=1 Tax=Paractinoplanes durhamensis TaxID=113563 RepID=UPI00363CD4D8
MADRVLIVDDEVRILDGLRRTLHGLYEVDTAASGAEGLALIDKADSAYAVVVSDMMMPGMSGAEFLGHAHDASPDSVQMVLSGQAELSATIAAVNDGNLFRFLTKPCESAEMIRALDAALAQYRLVQSERELLDHTLNGAVGVLTELMSVSNPTEFARTERVKAIVAAMLQRVVVPDPWELRIAAMLGQVGMMAVPSEVLTEVRAGGQISREAEAIYHSHPALGADLIRRIPRLHDIAEWVAAQPVTLAEAIMPMSARADPPEAGTTGRDVYATVMAFIAGVDAGLQPRRVHNDLAGCGNYRADLLDHVLAAHEKSIVRRPRRVKGAELTVGMKVEQDVVTTTGLILIRGERSSPNRWRSGCVTSLREWA